MIMHDNNLKIDLKLITVIFILGFTAYSFVLGAPFKTLDDLGAIVTNGNIGKLSNVGVIFKSSYFGEGSYYRPIVHLFYMAEYHFFGLNSFYYYLTSIAIHLLIGIIVFYLIKLFFSDRYIAFFTSLLFAIHPIHWEAVSNISGQAILLTALFFITSFYYFCLYLKKNNALKYYCCSIFFFIFALFTKETAITLPLMLFSYVYIFEKVGQRRIFHAVQKVIPYLFCTLAYFLIRSQLDIVSLFYRRTFAEIVLAFFTFLRGVITYLRLFIMPIGLYFDRSKAVFYTFFDLELGLTLCFYILLFLVIYKLRKLIPKNIFFFFSWFFIGLLPVSQIFAFIAIQRGYIATAEHFLYIPSVGIFVLLTVLAKVISGKKYLSTSIFRIVISLFMFFLFLTTIQQNIYSSSEVSMLTETLRHSPHNIRMRESLSASLIRLGLFQEAEIQYREILKVDPLNIKAQISLGKTLCDQGKYWEGIQEYEKTPRLTFGENQEVDGKTISFGETSYTQAQVKALMNLLDENLRLSYEVLNNSANKERHPIKLPIHSL